MSTDNMKIPPDDKCGVSEEMFPCMEKCCRKSKIFFLDSYEKVCPYCDISASLPHGESLMIVTIFECGRLGYGKKITE